MLLSFRVENHRSLRDEQELILIPADQSADGFPSPAEIKPLRATGIFGANASGKSSVVRAIAFMQRMVRGEPFSWAPMFSSYGPEGEDLPQIPREPFLLDGESEERPSGFAVELLLDGQRYSYGFTVDTTSVVEEWLHLESPGEEVRVIFERERLAFTYGDRDEDTPEITDMISVEPDSLLISVLANTSPRFRSEAVVALSRVRKWFHSTLQIRQGDMRSPADHSQLTDHPEILARLTLFARAVDIGISDYSIEENPLITEERELIEERFDKKHTPFIIRQRDRGRVAFHHRGSIGDRPLDFTDESSGTQALLTLGTLIMRQLERGGTLVVDEIDTSLHTLLSGSLISLFKDPENNPYGAQLIFTSHDTSLLGRVHGREVLTEDDIWLTEKGEDGATVLFPMSGYESSSEENRDRRYLVGRYGAVPFIGKGIPDLKDRAFSPVG